MRGMSAPSLRKKKSFARSTKPSRMCIGEHRGTITMSSAEVCWPVPMRAIGAQNLLTMPGGVTTAGYLHKKGGSQFSLMKWPLRYIILHKGCVYYFKTSTSPAPQGAFSLNGYNRVMRAAEETTSNNVFPFKIVHFSKKHRTWLFSAASEEERRKWMRCLRREIDHYNDRKEAHIPSDSDSDADSFYGTIEKPMDIKHPVDSPEDDYVEEDDDEDEEDYLKPDGDCAPSGRPAGPPPSYPPPPVPHTFQGRQGPPPSVPPLNKSPTIPLPKKPPPSALKDPGKAPPTLPFPPHPHRNLSPSPPPPPPPNPKRGLHNRAASVAAADRREWRPPPPAAHLPATLPICEQLESRMVLNGPAPHHHHPHPHPAVSKPVPPLPQARRSVPQMPVPLVLPPLPRHPPVSPQPAPHNKPSKPPPPIAKPPLPAGKSKPGFQRASPEGQSFRSQMDETPADFRAKPEKWGEGGSDCGEDYENVQLPDSVFIDTTETSVVEKLFRESFSPPQDGLYGIRNSGTKTSKVLVVWDCSIGKARNYRLFEENDCVFLDTDLTFLTLAALIEHYYSHPLPHHGSLCLQEPYTEPSANKN